jgi:uncharacterized protein YoxC
LNHGVAQALRHLPEEYVNKFFKGFIKEYTKIDLSIEMHPVKDKFLIPQVERITNHLWRIVGVSTYYQVRRGFDQLDGKMDEMSGQIAGVRKDTQIIQQQNAQLREDIQMLGAVVMEVYKTTLVIKHQLDKVQQKIAEIDANVKELVHYQKFKEITDAIIAIEQIEHTCERYQFVIEDKHLQGLDVQLLDAQATFSRVFLKGFGASHEIVLVEYKKMLKESMPNNLDVEMSTALWFRRMLDYQVKAMHLYASLRALRMDLVPGQPDVDLPSKLLQFEKILIDQLEANKDHVDMRLACESQDYIVVHINKSKILRIGE